MYNESIALYIEPFIVYNESRNVYNKSITMYNESLEIVIELATWNIALHDQVIATSLMDIAV